jgi:hypothetical protein
VGARSIGMYIHKISRQDNLIHPAETSWKPGWNY